MSPLHGTRVPPQLAALPLRTFRVRDAVDLYAHPKSQIARLEALGAVHRLAWGYYVVVPQDQTVPGWMPTLEAAAAGIAAATFGPRAAFLMGISAARVLGAIPRALATATVASPRQHKPVELLDRDATIRFANRDTTRLAVQATGTDLGRTLITTPEQTLLDLAKRPALGDAEGEVGPALQALWPRCELDVLEDLAQKQNLRSALVRAREWNR